MATPLIQEFEDFARSAMDCDACFQTQELKRALISLPQPKWVGPGFADAQPKVAIVLINPGAGTGWADEANRVLLGLLKDFREGGPFEPVMQHQRRELSNWGRGRFWSYFFSAPDAAGLGLDPHKVALVNIAWCATARNIYPRRLLTTCFERHTRTLLNLLAPDVVLLCGGATHSFAHLMPPTSKVFSLLHYAHREGKDVQFGQLANPQLRNALGIPGLEGS